MMASLQRFVFALVFFSTMGLGCGGTVGSVTRSADDDPVDPVSEDILVQPSTATVNVGGVQKLTAVTTSGVTVAATWSVMETGGGTVTEDGLYTAPSAVGLFHVRATSSSDATKLAVASVEVVESATCIAEDNASFCARNGKNCGSYIANDNCGTERTASCGACSGTETCGAVVPNVCGTLGSSGSHWVMGYYVGYQADEHPPAEVDFTAMSHVVMGAVLANADGSLDLTFYRGSPTAGATLAQDVSQRAHAAGKKALLMLGGEGGGASILAAAQNHRSTLVSNLVSAMSTLGYDGIDIDWEDDVDMNLFILLAQGLRAAAPNAVLTVPGYPLNSNYETADRDIATLVESLDQYNLMTYYPATAMAGGGWLSWHNSPLDGRKDTTPVTIADSFARYVEAGVPKEKLGMGVAFYAICYTGGITGPNQDTDSATIEGGDNEYPLSELLEPGSAYSASARKWDSTAQVPYLSLTTPERHGCRYVSYDDEESLIAKGTFAKQNGYGGIIVWTISQGYMPDRSAGQRNPLMQALKQGFLD